MEIVLLAWSVPIFSFFIVLEMVLSHFYKQKSYNVKDTLVNLSCTTLNFLGDLLMRGICLVILYWAYSFSGFTISNPYLYWFLLFLAQDLAYYSLHVLDHYCRFFWAVHITHHSSEKFNLTVAIRSSVFQPFYRFVFYMPLAFVGFKPLDILFMYAICQTYGFFVHTEWVGKLGFLEYFVVTPSHHRVHHASNPLYLDKNMGMVLIVWDRIFGTFEPENEKPIYGITTGNNTYHIGKIVFGEWYNIWKDVRSSSAIFDKIRYVFGRPGWKPDTNNSENSNQID